MLSSFKLSANTKVEKAADSLGGGGFILDSAIYPFKIDVAYIGSNDYGNTTLNIRYTGIDGNSKAYRETLNITDDKGNIEVADKQGVMRPFWGFTKANAFLQVVAGKDISEMETKSAKIKEYDFKAGGDVMVDREVLVELIGMPVKLGVTKNVNNKKMKDPTGNWINDPTGATKETNKTHTVFRHADNMTAAEIERDADEAKFHLKWSDKFDGEVMGKVEAIKGGAVAGVPGAPAAPAAALVFE